MKIFSILNITPDSFSDAGLFASTQSAIFHAQSMLYNSYAIDIGPQSTRPNAIMIGAEQEIARLDNIIEQVSKFAKTSIDSFYFETQKVAIQQGVSYINDVTGFRDVRILQYAPGNVKFIFMHNLGVPPMKTNVMQETDHDVISEIKLWARNKLREFQNIGISSDRFIFDIGIGFGKTAQQSLYLVNNIEQFADFDVPIMVGHSRKSFMHLINPNATIDEKDAITKQMTEEMSAKGIEYFRVHNVS